MGILRASVSAIRRLTAMIRRSEGTPVMRPRANRGSREPVPRPPYPDQLVAVRFSEDIPEEHDADDEYNGQILPWTPSRLSNKGDYLGTNVRNVVLRDTLELGIYGDSGARAVGRIRHDGTGKMFVELWGSECPSS